MEYIYILYIYICICIYIILYIYIFLTNAYLVGGLEYLDYDFPIIHWEWNVIIPTDDTMLQVP